MKGYIKPEIVEISDVMETVGLTSGGITIDDSAHVSLVWTGHDHGSMSLLWVGATRDKTTLEGGPKSITITLTLNDKRRFFVGLAPDDRPDFNKIEVISCEPGGQTLIIKSKFGVSDRTTDYTLHLIFSPGPLKAGREDLVKQGSYTIPENMDFGWEPNYELCPSHTVGSCVFDGAGNAKGTGNAFTCGAKFDY